MKDYKKRRQLTHEWMKVNEDDELSNWEDFIRHDAVEEYKKKQLALFSVSQQRELLIDFLDKLNKAPLAEYMDYEDIVDDFEKGNL